MAYIWRDNFDLPVLKNDLKTRLETADVFKDKILWELGNILKIRQSEFRTILIYQYITNSMSSIIEYMILFKMYIILGDVFTLN